MGQRDSRRSDPVLNLDKLPALIARRMLEAMMNEGRV